MIPVSTPRWHRLAPPAELSAELVTMLVEEARRVRRPYRVPAPGSARPAAATVQADRTIRRYRMALL